MAVTGTPGAGKSTFAKELGKRLGRAAVIEINDVAKTGKHFSGIDKAGAMVVKPIELSNAINAEIKEGLKRESVIVVGHLVPELEMDPDVVVVIKARLNELIKRLEGRKYTKDKIRENIVSEAIDYCGTVCAERWHNTFEVNGKEQEEEIMDYIIALANGGKPKPPKTRSGQRLDELLELIDDGNKYGF